MVTPLHASKGNSHRTLKRGGAVLIEPQQRTMKYFGKLSSLQRHQAKIVEFIARVWKVGSCMFDMFEVQESLSTANGRERA